MKMILLLTGLLLIFTPVAQAATGQWTIGDPVQWEISDGGNGHFYEYVNTGYHSQNPLWWETAEAAAEKAGGYLVTITSQEEDDWIWTNLGGSELLHSWIGGYQPNGSEEPAGGWSWVTGEPWGYEKWAPGEPNNFINDPEYFDNIESVVMLGKADDLTNYWNDLPPDSFLGNYGDNYASGFIVEWSSVPPRQVVAPEPASMILFGVGGAAMAFMRRRKA